MSDDQAQILLEHLWEDGYADNLSLYIDNVYDDLNHWIWDTPMRLDKIIESTNFDVSNTDMILIIADAWITSSKDRVRQFEQWYLESKEGSYDV